MKLALAILAFTILSAVSGFVPFATPRRASLRIFSEGDEAPVEDPEPEGEAEPEAEPVAVEER